MPALCLLVSACGAGTPYPSAADRFDKAKNSPPLARAFLYRMPKGGDLHNHLSGAAYAENLIREGAARGACYDQNTNVASDPPCDKGKAPLSEALTKPEIAARLANAWSMRDFIPVSGHSGHDQFFDAFAKFGAAATKPAMAAEITDRAGRQRMRYVELMITFQGGAVMDLANRTAKQTSWRDDYDGFQAALMRNGLSAIVHQGVADAAQLERDVRTLQRCGTDQASPGCGVSIRWLEQVTRTGLPWQVYAQTLFGALLAQATDKVVGIDYVAPEDNPVALADYTRQMWMIDHVFRSFPATNISLHAGELTLGTVSPEHLLFHIRQAVELGHAKRIGHGVDVMYEENPHALLREMAANRVAVEINLTSNAQILQVEGPDHPFPIYRAAGVPTVISTDDEGIERIDRTHELQRAVQTYGLHWNDLLDMERNTLEYAFVQGESLWADPIRWRMVGACSSGMSAACDAFLQANEKARLQWGLERDLAEFDREVP
jgi:adenosine deaminase